MIRHKGNNHAEKFVAEMIKRQIIWYKGVQLLQCDQKYFDHRELSILLFLEIIVVINMNEIQPDEHYDMMGMRRKKTLKILDWFPNDIEENNEEIFISNCIVINGNLYFSKENFPHN